MSDASILILDIYHRLDYRKVIAAKHMTYMYNRHIDNALISQPNGSDITNNVYNLVLNI